MTRIVIEVDEHPSWAECTKEAVAERLSDLGGVRVVECTVDKPQQMGLFERPAAVPKGPGESRDGASAPRRRGGSADPEQHKGGAPGGPVGSLGSVCPGCGARIVRVRGPEGGAVMREIRPRSFWPDPAGPQWVMNIEEKWQRGSLEGDRNAEHTVGFPIHACEKEGTQ